MSRAQSNNHHDDPEGKLSYWYILGGWGIPSIVVEIPKLNNMSWVVRLGKMKGYTQKNGLGWEAFSKKHWIRPQALPTK